MRSASAISAARIVGEGLGELRGIAVEEIEHSGAVDGMRATAGVNG